MNANETYYNARMAIRDDKSPEAYLNLGILYAKGIGTRENHTLANYFYEKALALGCREAEAYIDMEYDWGVKDIVNEIERAVADEEAISPDKMQRLKRRLEKERTKQNYGTLSELRHHLHLFYPYYNQEKATADILAQRDTVDADIYYSLCTSQNTTETRIDWLEQIQHQLYAPVIENDALRLRAEEMERTALLDKDEEEFVQALNNLSSSYATFCKRHDIPRQELTTPDCLELLPFIKVRTLVQIRKQAFACLLSLKEIAPVIKDEYMNHLDDDDKLLNICEQVEDQDLQLFLISYVEVNVDMETLGLNYHGLLSAYRKHDRTTFADLLNESVERLTEAGVEHRLPLYTPDNLPPIEIG
ncbi:MAG: hypothetical protein K2O17_05740 [Bacteroidaceae bacterium]|nr:hypothetical protein [Bacteroidaceae bacterium]